MRSFLLASVIAVGLLATSVATAAPSILGDYAAVGENPGGKGKYKGTVNITKDGQTFHLKWQVGPEAYIGTGILSDNFLAVAYTDSKGSWFGVVIYKILDKGKILDGKWTMAGGKAIGLEKLTRK